jgi:hypothetical protein
MSSRTPLHGLPERHWYAAKFRTISDVVGRTQKARLRWLVENFAAQANLGTAFKSRTAEIAAFLLNQGGAGTRLSAMPRISSADQIYLAKTAKEGVDLVIGGMQWKVAIRESLDRILVQRTGIRGVDPDEPFGARSTWQPHSKEALLTAFLLTAADLIERQQSWLRRCPREDCGRVFVQEDKRQRYCSPRCSQTTRTRLFRRKIGR